MATWKKLITECMNKHNETFDDVKACTLSEVELNTEFDDCQGEGKDFTLWTKARVYFPVMYDGDEWVGSVSRNPDGVSTSHFGG